MKIGFFETWNQEANMVERSFTRLGQFIVLAVFCFINIKVFFGGLPGKDLMNWMGFISFDLLLLTAIFIPSKIKDWFSLIKNKILNNNIKG
jgi:energy-coupling factor transporter transmembrane protein EcfT